jgi:hypothetical protein
VLTDFEIDRNLLAEVCEHWHIRSLSVFASALRDDFGPDSDVDVLIEFDSEHVPGWEMVDIGDDLSKVFGRRYVDMVFPASGLPRLKARVLGTAGVQYERQ